MKTMSIVRDDTTEAADPVTAAAEWQLRLYVAGQTPRSMAALANLKRVCETHLAAGQSAPGRRRPDSGRADPGSQGARTDPQDHRRPLQ
jgi:hypothetical protein